MKKLKIDLDGFKVIIHEMLLQEGRVDWLRKNYVGKQASNVNEQDITSDIFEKILDADPTKKKLYSQWMLNLYYNGDLKLEDLYKASEYLELFHANKNKIEQKDINKYGSIVKLYQAVKPLEGGDEESMGSNELIKKIKHEETKRYYEDDKWLVVIPKTERASCLYGKGTQWCTAADTANNMFDKYNDKGDLYIAINKKTGKKYQFHFETNQFMDENDEDVSILFIFKSNLSKIFKKQLSQIVEVDFANNNLTSIPKELVNLSQLEQLNLSKNNLTSIPKELGNLSQLEWLYLDNNKLISIPKELGDLTQLRGLYLHNNKLTSIPKELGNLSQLKLLDLLNNKLTYIPKEIGNLSQLKILDLSGNPLSQEEVDKVREMLPNTSVKF